MCKKFNGIALAAALLALSAQCVFSGDYFFQDMGSRVFELHALNRDIEYAVISLTLIPEKTFSQKTDILEKARFDARKGIYNLQSSIITDQLDAKIHRYIDGPEDSLKADIKSSYYKSLFLQNKAAENIENLLFKLKEYDQILPIKDRIILHYLHKKTKQGIKLLSEFAEKEGVPLNTYEDIKNLEKIMHDRTCPHFDIKISVEESEIFQESNEVLSEITDINQTLANLNEIVEDGDKLFITTEMNKIEGILTDTENKLMTILTLWHWADNIKLSDGTIEDIKNSRNSHQCLMISRQLRFAQDILTDSENRFKDLALRFGYTVSERIKNPIIAKLKVK